MNCKKDGKERSKSLCVQGFNAVGVNIKNDAPFLQSFGGVVGCGVAGWVRGGCGGGGTVGVSIKV